MKSKVTLINIISSLTLQVVTVISGFIIPKIILTNFGSSVNGLVSSLNQFLSYITLIEGGITGVAVSIYLVQMMLADGLYWLIRDYYHNNQKGQVFVNAFGEMFEDYFEELMGEYLKNGFWHKIPENKKKSADYYVEFEKAVFIFELKSGMLGIGAKQQTPNVDLIDIFYKRNIEKAYKQLKNSELEYKGDKPVIKIFLLYESMPSNTQMIISSLPELFEKDSNCYVMTIEELEMFLTTYKKDRVKFDNIVSRLITSENGARRYKSVFEVLREYQATENMQFTGEKDYFEKIVHSYIGEHTE